MRPTLVVGFAAETQDVWQNAGAKLKKKRRSHRRQRRVADQRHRSFGRDGRRSHRELIVSKVGVEEWPEISKNEVTARLAERLKTIVV